MRGGDGAESRMFSGSLAALYDELVRMMSCAEGGIILLRTSEKKPAQKKKVL